MNLDLSTVGNVANAVNCGLLTRADAIRFLTDCGFTDADEILRDLCGEETPR